MDLPHRPAPPTGWRRLAFRLPVGLYRLRLGGLLGARFVLIHHTGRRSGQPGKVVVEVVTRHPSSGAIVVASGFGPEADWYRNLLVTQDATSELGWRHLDVHAAPLTPEQAGQTMVDYAHRHPHGHRAGTDQTLWTGLTPLGVGMARLPRRAGTVSCSAVAAGRAARRTR